MTIATELDLRGLASISLTDLQQQAAFLTRRDRKYLVPLDGVAQFLATLDPQTRMLEHDDRRSFRYQSAYFDDPNLASYHAARCRRPRRFKVRTRLYLDSGECHLEVKVRDNRGRTVKHRCDVTDHPPLELRPADRQWLGSFPVIADLVDALDVRMLTEYERSTLLLPEAEGRVTIDRGLAFSAPGEDRLEVSTLAVIETKGAGHPTNADRLLWQLGYRPLRLSKYAVGMSVLRPTLPANRWHRVRQHLLSDLRSGE